jgi:ribosomal protein S18 acetylase RimI-like enzyme
VSDATANPEQQPGESYAKLSASEVTIRRADFKDADAIATIHERSRREAMPWLAIVHSALETRGWIGRTVLKLEDVYVATDHGGKILGYAAWRDDSLNHLYVHPASQRRGVGSMLLRHAKRHMPRGFRFWVFQRNAAARAFYEKHGCVLVRETDGSGNEEREPDAQYEWGLAL